MGIHTSNEACLLAGLLPSLGFSRLQRHGNLMPGGATARLDSCQKLPEQPTSLPKLGQQPTGFPQVALLSGHAMPERPAAILITSCPSHADSLQSPSSSSPLDRRLQFNSHSHMLQPASFGKHYLYHTFLLAAICRCVSCKRNQGTSASGQGPTILWAIFEHSAPQVNFIAALR